ncbi:hypothetical protein SRHO_G00146430 [Serrasalmus rhombeus]
MDSNILESVNTAGYENPLALTRLVETTGFLTPPGFDAAPSTSTACEPGALTTFRPCLTSSPGSQSQCGKSQSGDDKPASRGKRPRTCLSTNNGSISHWKRFRFDDSYKSADLHTNDHAVCVGEEQTGSTSEFDAVVWTEELLNTWDQNSFTEKPDDTVDTGLNPISDVRDIDEADLKANQEHERRARKKYPVGHPQIFFKNFRPLEEYYGLVKATVHPPRKLLHPVLPYRCIGKLMFPLCRTCAEQENQLQTCTHCDEDRSITRSWVSIELVKAVEKGYVVVKIHEVWHFPDSSETLFCEYVKTFLQYKQEASGYPAHAVTEEERAEYIRDYFEKEKIQLNPDKISLIPARRSINKLLLNSLWGRFSMRENLPVSELLTDPEQFSQHIFGNGYDVKHF